MTVDPQPTTVNVYSLPDGRWRIHCPDCRWNNTFDRVQNAVTRLSEHALVKHHKRRSWPNIWKTAQ